jgi:hypothetical protein
MVATAAAVLLVNQSHSSDASVRVAAVEKMIPTADVRVRHDFVTVALPPPIKGVTPRLGPPATSLSASAGSAQSPATSPSPPRRTRTNDGPLLAKVGRAVAGDGRYRPEPFPRVR